jgi:hypothetical protein
MSELYKHLLIPKSVAFMPDEGRIAQFFSELQSLEALPKDAQYVAITYTGKTRPYFEDNKTGEVFYGPELRVDRFSDIQSASDSIREARAFHLYAEGEGPATIPPFELYRANRGDVHWQEPYTFRVNCVLRKKAERLRCSPITCKCEYKPDEIGIFENPWNREQIETSGLAWARFTVEFGIGDYLMPMITGSLDILDARLVEATNRIFGEEFTQGCICNDD